MAVEPLPPPYINELYNLEFPFWSSRGSEYKPIRLPANPFISCFAPGLSQRRPTAIPGS